MGKNKGLFVLMFVIILKQTHAQNGPEVKLRWIDNTPVVYPTGVSWGIPWAKGTVKKNERFSLTNAAGEALPVQSWTTAYWPDGSVKWTGFATVAGSKDGSLKLSLNNDKV